MLNNAFCGQFPLKFTFALVQIENFYAKNSKQVSIKNTCLLRCGQVSKVRLRLWGASERELGKSL
jgi:hypothetical protein